MLIVTGATGHLGSLIVDHLLARVPADTVGVSVRDVGKATGLVDRGVRVRVGDFTDPGSLAHAFEGATAVMVVSAAIRGGGAAAANIAAIDAACAAGADRIIYTSHQASSPTSLFPPQWAHAETEAHLAGLDVRWTALRNGFYASSLDFLIGDALQTGRLLAPEDGPVSWTAHTDLAEAAAIAVVDGEVSGGARLDGATAPLVAAQATDLAQICALLADVTGRVVTRVVVGDEEWRDAVIERGMPAGAADVTLGLYRAARRGEFAVADATLQSLLGRPPATVRSVLEAMAPRLIGPAPVV